MFKQSDMDCRCRKIPPEESLLGPKYVQGLHSTNTIPFSFPGLNLQHRDMNESVTNYNIHYYIIFSYIPKLLLYPPPSHHALPLQFYNKFNP